MAASPSVPRRSPVEIAFLAAVMLVVVVSRRLFFAHYLVDWDSVAFADALHHFDVTRNWPHPPGFPVYILLGRLAYALVRDEAAALSWVNCLLSAATIPLVFSLGRRWLGARPAAVWTVWWATQPLFWYYGAAQLTYPTEAGCALLLVWLWTRRPAVPAGLGGLLFGLAGGVRVSTYAVLGLVFVDWLRQRSARERGWALAGAAVGAAAWGGSPRAAPTR